MQYGTGTKPGPLSLEVAEEEYAACLRQFTGEQYELMPNDGHFIPPQLPNGVPPPESPLFTIRHVLRTNKNTIKILGIYYVMEGVIYKSPNVRSLMKSIVTKTIDGLSEACDALSKHARYEPSTGYTWYFDDNSSSDEEDEDHSMTFPTSRRLRLRKKRRILDNRRPGERTEEKKREFGHLRQLIAFYSGFERIPRWSVIKYYSKDGVSAHENSSTKYMLYHFDPQKQHERKQLFLTLLDGEYLAFMKQIQKSNIVAPYKIVFSREPQFSLKSKNNPFTERDNLVKHVHLCRFTRRLRRIENFH